MRSLIIVVQTALLLPTAFAFGFHAMEASDTHGALAIANAIGFAFVVMGQLMLIHATSGEALAH